MVPPNNFFIMDLIETFHISRKWSFFGLLSHALFPLPIHLLRENFDFECTDIIKHQFVLKSKKKKEFTVPWAQHFSSKQSSSWRYYFDREGEALIGSLFDATLHRGRILLYQKFISMEEHCMQTDKQLFISWMKMANCGRPFWIFIIHENLFHPGSKIIDLAWNK